MSKEPLEQEDDVTLVTLQHIHGYGMSGITTRTTNRLEELETIDGKTNSDAWHTLGEWTLPSQPGNERLAMEQVAQMIQPLHLPKRRLEQLQTAVAEATMNAMEHGNHYMPEKPVSISVAVSKAVLSVRISDKGGTQLLVNDAEPPASPRYLAELQSPRGWGLFLIKNMVDDMRITSDATHHTVELILYLEGGIASS